MMSKMNMNVSSPDKIVMCSNLTSPIQKIIWLTVLVEQFLFYQGKILIADVTFARKTFVRI